VLRAAAAFEAVQPWAAHVPPVVQRLSDPGSRARTAIR